MAVADCSEEHMTLPYEILEISGVLDRKNLTNLILVARRVQFWIEPILYETVVLNSTGAGAKFLCTLRSKPSTFFTENVKNLCLAEGVTVPEAERILSICTGVEDLACWVTPDSYASAVLLPIISKMHLRKLSLNHRKFLCSDPKGYTPPSATGFQGITHLDLANPWAMWNVMDLGIEVFPSLTHVAFRLWTRDSVIPCILRVLDRCLSLRVLALLVQEQLLPAASKFLIEEGLDDARIALVGYGKDVEFWRELEEGQPVLWARVESICADHKCMKGKCT